MGGSQNIENNIKATEEYSGASSKRIVDEKLEIKSSKLNSKTSKKESEKISKS